MRCRSCGTEVADKALICYRCGAATTEAKYQPPARRRTASSATLLATAIALALVMLLAVFSGRANISNPSRIATTTVVGIAVLVVGLRAWARRR
jgi:uncharacterized membrane protein YvbJ